MTLPINGTVPVVTGSSSTGEKKGRSDLISVVMPCFNAAPFLEQAVRSVMDQTCPEVELIVVDDGSTDGTSEFVKKYRKKLRYYRHENVGIAKTRTIACELAKGNELRVEYGIQQYGR